MVSYLYLIFPNEEFDENITVNISNYQANKYRKLLNYKFSPSITTFDFSDEDNPIYTLTFRVVRIKLDSGKYESIITNLFDGFLSEDIKELYHLRWGIETSFRQLKYAIDLTNFHAKKKNSIMQEIYARLIIQYFCESIVQNTLLNSRPTKHNYKINFSSMSQILKILYYCPYLC